MQSKTDFKYPADIVWACAAAADRINGGYRKTSNWDYTEDDSIESPGNKTRVLRWLEQWRNNLLRKFEVTDQDAADGKRAQAFWQSQMLVLLDDSANDYLKACVNAAHLTTVNSLTDIAVIASAITAAKRETRKQELIQRKHSLKSKHVCALGSSVNFDTEFEVVDSRYINTVGASAVECIAEGNLYMWWSRQHVEPGMYRFLKGRVKAHEKDYATGQPVTKLNYVKVH